MSEDEIRRLKEEMRRLKEMLGNSAFTTDSLGNVYDQNDNLFRDNRGNIFGQYDADGKPVGHPPFRKIHQDWRTYVYYPNGELQAVLEHEYDGGPLTKETYYYPDGKIGSITNIDGYGSKRTRFWRNGTVASTTVIEGNEEIFTTFRRDGTKKKRYVTEGRNNVVEEYDESGSLISTDRYKDDAY
jgi:antitoxin component YwqK of YwqJK toxin-antitoxin module